MWLKFKKEYSDYNKKNKLYGGNVGKTESQGSQSNPGKRWRYFGLRRWIWKTMSPTFRSGKKFNANFIFTEFWLEKLLFILN